MHLKKLTLLTLTALCLTACTNSQEIGEIKPNYEGEYQTPFVNIFAEVVNTGTTRNATGNVFIRDFLQKGDRAIEVYPGSTYEPDFPKLQKGYTAEILFEEVNRHAEKPKELYSVTTTNPEEAKVEVPNKPGALLRYTIKVRDENGEFKDIRYDPLFTTFEDYNFVMNVRKPIYDRNEKITLNIENWGPNHLSYSNDWKVFKQKGEEWKKVEFLIENRTIAEPGVVPSAWNMDDLLIDADSELLLPGRNQTINFNHVKLGKGVYKIQGKMGSAKHVFTVEDIFEVK